MRLNDERGESIQFELEFEEAYLWHLSYATGVASGSGLNRHLVINDSSHGLHLFSFADLLLDKVEIVGLDDHMITDHY